jgi:hypothetical protein
VRGACFSNDRALLGDRRYFGIGETVMLSLMSYSK